MDCFLSLYLMFYNIACFMFWVFGQEACGILASRPRMEPVPPTLEGEVLTTGESGKSPRGIA